MDNEIYTDDLVQKECNQRGLLLVQTRFNQQFKPFIKGSVDRLAYVRRDIARMVEEIADHTGADFEYLTTRFDQYLAEVAVTKPQKQELEFSPEELKEGNPPAKNDPDQVDPEPDATTDVRDHGTVLEDEALEPDARIDVETGDKKSLSFTDKDKWVHCFRCDKEMNPVVSSASPVCPDCTKELREREALAPTVNPTVGPAAQAPNYQQYMSPRDQNPNAVQLCNLCAARGQHWEGTEQEFQQHLQTSHPEVATQQTQAPLAAKKAGPEDMSPPNPAPDAVNADEGLSEEQNPVHHFDDIIQKMADRAAAIQYSTPDDEEIQTIADRYGLQPDEIKSKLQVSATFGEFTAINGELTSNKNDVPTGYTEVDMEGMGGQVETHTANVPTDLAAEKVASDLGMEKDLVYNMLKDSYGDDLGDQYSASVSGEHRFFLPESMTQGEAQPTNQDSTQPTQPPAVQPQPVSRFTLAELIETDKRAAREAYLSL